MKKSIFFSLVLAATLSAQSFGVGLRAGAPLTDAISVSYNSADSITNDHYIIGPYVEIGIARHFAIEVDALYRAFSYFQGNPYVVGASGSNGNWEFPVMAKYKFLPGPTKPYVEGGLVLSHLTGSSFNVANSSNFGITLGGGVEMRIRAVRLSPEIRYDGFAFKDFVNTNFVQSNRNRVMVLVGIGLYKE